MRRIAVGLVGALAVAVSLCSAAVAAPGLLVGASDDYVKSEPGRAGPAIQDLGLGAIRVTLDWRPGTPSISGGDAAGLANAISAAGGTRIVVAVYSDVADDAPKTPEARDEYCGFLRALVTAYPQIGDVVVWNEPNKSTFWKPQFDGTASAAPGAYLQLLLRCHQVLHEARSSVNVIHAGLSSTGNDRPDAQSNVSHSPGNFVRKEGEAYRALFVDVAKGPRAFDTFALHAYGETSLELPWTQHLGSSTVAMGDITTKLVQALHDAFAGTGQGVPGLSARPSRGLGSERAAGIWILENGFQTSIPPEQQGSYAGAENVSTVAPRARAGDAEPVPPRTQALQVTDAIRVAYCNPYVTGYFNFLLRDDHDLGRWQSGLLWANWTPKPSYEAVKGIVQQVRAGTVDCSDLPANVVGPFAARQGVDVRRVEWPGSSIFNWRNDLWRFRIQSGEPATYTARLIRIGPARSPAARGGAVLSATGNLRKLYFAIVKFPQRRLRPGRYLMEITLTSAESAGRTTTLRSPVFRVGHRRG